MKRKFKHTLWRIPVMCLMAVAASFFLNGCNEEDPEFLLLSEDNVHVEAGSCSVTIDVRSNVAWTATSSDTSWCRISNSKGSFKGSFAIVCDDNVSVDARSATITVTSKTMEETIVIRQAGVGGALAISPQTIQFTKSAGTHTVNVVSNTEWKVGSPSASWFAVSTQNGSGTGLFTISAQENTTGADREGAVIVSVEVAGNIVTREVKVEQLANVSAIVLSPNNKTLGTLAEDFNVTVISTVKWKASSSDTWLTIDKTSGNSGETIVKVSAAENKTGVARTGEIIVWDADNENGDKVKLSVTQLSTDAELNVSPTSFTLGEEADSRKVVVTSNRSWHVHTTAEWCTPSITQGEDNGSFNIEVSANETGAVRTATVVVSVNENGIVLSREITIEQKAVPSTLRVSPGDAYISNNSQNIAFAISTKIGWIASVSAEWIKIVGADSYGTFSATGDYNLVIEADKNSSGIQREATLTVRTVGQSGDPEIQTVTIRQSATDAQLKVSDETVIFRRNKDSYAVTVTSNRDWEVSSSSSWCHVTVTDKKGFIISVDNNSTGYERTAKVTVTVDEEGAQLMETITVIQKTISPMLDVSPTEITVNHLGTTTQKVTIVTEAVWEIVSNNSWITIDAEEDKAGVGDWVVTLTIDPNTLDETRVGTVVVRTVGLHDERETRTITITQTGVPSYLIVTPESLNYTKEGGTQRLVVTSNIDWTASTSITGQNAWCSVQGSSSGSNDGVINIRVNENQTGNERTATITVKGTDGLGNLILQEITIHQSGVPATIQVSPTEQTVNNLQQTFLVNVVTEVDWTYRSSDSWLTISGNPNRSGTGTFTVNVAANTTGQDRIGTITVHTRGDDNALESHTITVVQQSVASYLEVTPDALSFTKNGGTQHLTVSSNINWNSQVSISGGGSWCSVSNGTGSNNGRITVNTTANATDVERTATITVRGTDILGNPIVKEITITQTGKTATIQVSPTEKSINNLANTFSVNVVTEVDWTYRSNDNWLTISNNGGGLNRSGTGTITVNATANTTGADRYGSITVYTRGSSTTLESHTISVKQSSVDSYIDVSPNALTFAKEVATRRLTVSSNISWTASTTFTTGGGSGAWFTINNTSGGSGMRSIDVTVTANTTDAERTGTITVKGTDALGNLIVEEITVVQTGKSATILLSPTEKTLDNAAQTFNATVTSDVDWAITSSDTWLTFTGNANRAGSETVAINVTANDTGKDRTGTITVSTRGTDTTPEMHTLTVTQSADEYSLELPVNEFILSNAEHEIDVKYLFKGLAGITVAGGSGAEWIELGIAGTLDAIGFKVKANTSGLVRRGTVSVFTTGQSGEPIIRTATVWQSPTVERMDVFFPDINISAMGETQLIPIDANIVITNVRSGSEWCAASLVDGDVQIVAEYNDTGIAREAIVTVTATLANGEKVEKAFKVTQAYTDLPFEFEKREYNFSHRKETQTILLIATGAWEMTTPEVDIPDWLSINKTEGEGTTSINVTVEENKFARQRFFNLTFVNELTGKTAIVTIRQDKDPGSAIEDYAYLGKGYNASGEFANALYVREAVLDCDMLEKANLIAASKTESETRETSITEKSLETFQQGLSTYFGISGGFKGFTASVKAAFTSESLESKENEFGLFRSVTKRQVVQIVDGSTTIDKLKPCLIPSAHEDIIGTSMSADDVIAKYGTHVIVGFSLGGSLDFWMTADQTEMQNKSAFSVSIKAGYKFFSAGVETEAGYSQFKEMQTKSYHFESKLIARGGDTQFASGKGSAEDYSSWLASLSEPAKWTLVDFEGDKKLIPISEFATGVRKSELEAAITNAINSAAATIVQSSSYKVVTFSVRELLLKDNLIENPTNIYPLFGATLDGEVMKSTDIRPNLTVSCNPNENKDVSVSWKDLSFNRTIRMSSPHTIKFAFVPFYGLLTPLAYLDPMGTSENAEATIQYDPASKVWYSDKAVGAGAENNLRFLLRKVFSSEAVEVGHIEVNISAVDYVP